MRLRSGWALLLLLSAASAWAKADLQVSASAIRPSQMQIGREMVKDIVSGWKAEAAHHGMSLKKYAESRLAKHFKHLDLPGVIDPDGHVRTTDGHHRLSALAEVRRETGVDIEVGMKILRDYRGKSERAFATDFIGRLHKGEFTPEVEGLSATEKVKLLPKTMKGMKDNPLRSAIGRAFDRNGIDSTLMGDYVEFKLGRELLKKGFLRDLKKQEVVGDYKRSLPAGKGFDPNVQETLDRWLAKKSVKHFLLTQARDKHARKELKHELQDVDD